MKSAVTLWGAGSFSAALVSCLCYKKTQIYVWTREESSSSCSASLSSFLVSLRSAAESSKIWIFCVPAQALRYFLRRIKESTPVHPRVIVLACKGIETCTGYLMSEIVEQFFPSVSQVVIAGPNFASELLAQHLSGITCATYCK